MTSFAPKAAETGEGSEAKAASSQIADRPMLVYIEASDPTAKETRKLEDVIFRNETLAVGTKFFRCLKISEANAEQDRILAETGRLAPRLVFVLRDYTVDSVIKSRYCSASKIIRSMKRAVRETYENRFDRMVKGYIKLLTKMDGLESVRLRLEDKRRRLADDRDPRAARELARDQKEYEEDLAKWREAEKKLLEFKLKGDEKTQA